MVPDFLEHLANLTVTPFVQRHFEPGIIGFFDYANLGGGGANALFRIALLGDGDSAPKTPKLLFRRLSGNFDEVCFGNVRRRLHELVCEGTVVRKQQESLAVEVKASDRIQASPAAHKFHHCGAALGIGDRGDVSPWLVKNQVLVALRALKKLVVNANRINFGIGFTAEFSDGGSVDAHQA